VYLSDFCLRIEIDLDELPYPSDCRLVLGGKQRGGVTATHLPFYSSPEGGDQLIDQVLTDVREQLMGYLARRLSNGIQSSFRQP